MVEGNQADGRVARVETQPVQVGRKVQQNHVANLAISDSVGFKLIRTDQLNKIKDPEACFTLYNVDFFPVRFVDLLDRRPVDWIVNSVQDAVQVLVVFKLHVKNRDARVAALIVTILVVHADLFARDSN